LADQIGCVREADLSRAQAERTGVLQARSEVRDQAGLEAVEDPGDPERDDHAPVPPRPTERVQAAGNVGRDPRAGGRIGSRRRRPRGYVLAALARKTAGHAGAALPRSVAARLDCSARRQRERRKARLGVEFAAPAAPFPADAATFHAAERLAQIALETGVDP